LTANQREFALHCNPAGDFNRCTGLHEISQSAFYFGLNFQNFTRPCAARDFHVPQRSELQTGQRRMARVALRDDASALGRFVESLAVNTRGKLSRAEWRSELMTRGI